MMGRNGATDLLPRHAYFHAVDRQGETDALVEKMIPFEQSRRHKLLLSAVQDAENLITALKTTRQFDRHGNIELVLPQISDALADVVTKTRNFIADVETCTDRYRKTLTDSTEDAGGQPVEPAAAVESPDVPAAAAPSPMTVHVLLDPRVTEDLDDFAETAPKPGPHLSSVTVFDPARSPRDQLAALDRATARRAKQLRGGRR
ncbi:hypothetical protein OCL88_08135 [Paenarthrobacter sp. PAE-2]|uniref:hypothetical protein n=1 Tax=Paenarthrobacter sp. PAE-2 TaxID=2982532 RepID=UPI00222FE1DF|nr:hypothetical protein [Paenarthrobacter sp. PAE-2]MCW3766440.1 hypothetical protein [Paenarthrobacter sp. PAE-2]